MEYAGTMPLAAAAGGFLLGGLTVWLVMSMRAGKFMVSLQIENASLRKEKEADMAKIEWLENAEKKMRDVFSATATEALRNNSQLFMQQSRDQLSSLHSVIRGDWNTHKEEFKNIINPIEKDLDRLDRQVKVMEEKREGAYRSIETHILSLSRAHQELQQAATTLSQALKSSSVRGKWGEVQLRRIAEMAGMMEHVDFSEQTATDMGTGRPDMIVRLPGKGIIPVDAKAPMRAYLAASEASGEEERRRFFAEHAKALRSHVSLLSRKEYWSQFESSPEFIVMLVPYESGLSAAFITDPALLDDALNSRVIIVSPATMLALLKVVSLGWMQLHVSQNARQIADQGKELYKRLGIFTARFNDVGSKISASVKSYNEAVASMEGRLIPAARRLKEFGAGSDEVQGAEMVETQVRAPLQIDDED